MKNCICAHLMLW